MDPNQKEYLTAQESFSFLGISKSFFYRIKKARGLRTFSIGDEKAGKTLFRKEDLLALIGPDRPELRKVNQRKSLHGE